MHREDTSDLSSDGEFVVKLIDKIDSDLALKIHNHMAEQEPNFITALATLSAVLASGIAQPSAPHDSAISMARGICNVIMTLTNNYWQQNHGDPDATPDKPSRLS